MLSDLLLYSGQRDQQRKPHGLGTMEYKTNGDQYEGAWVHGLQQGFGVMKYAIYRSVYVGEWFRGKRHGLGSTLYPSGQMHSGLYIEDEPQGKGVMHYPDGGYYWGDLVRFVRHGVGLMRYSDGKVYEGDWFNDEKHGYGKLTEKDTYQYYHGYWQHNLQHGRGKLVKFHPYSKSLTTYEGLFAQGKLQGQGFMSDEQGAQYRGEFEDGEKHGTGIMYQPCGDMYQGTFRRDFFNRGVAKLENGTNISGQFFNLLPDGYAAVDYQNGSYYQGNMTVGQRQGEGELHTMDGVTLVSHFDEDVPHGLGTLRFEDGSEYTSMFVRGKEVLDVEKKGKAKAPEENRLQ